jgi:hypothetical protein
VSLGQDEAICLGFPRKYGAVGEGSNPVAPVEATHRNKRGIINNPRFFDAEKPLFSLDIVRPSIEHTVSAGSIGPNLRGVNYALRLYEVRETGIAVIQVTCRETSDRKQFKHKGTERLGRDM